MTCAVPAGLGFQHLHVGRSNWCVPLQTRPIRAPDRRPWSSVNASGTHVPVHSHGAVNGPMRSLGVFSRQRPKWPIKVGSWQPRVCRRGEENLRGWGEREHKMIAILLRIWEISRPLAQKEGFTSGKAEQLSAKKALDSYVTHTASVCAPWQYTWVCTYVCGGGVASSWDLFLSPNFFLIEVKFT